MSGAPSVSCLIPAYNAARFIGEAIESARAQTHPLFEIIVVDDGSTDETVDVVRRCGPGVQLIAEEHRGYLAARDRAIAAAGGEFIAFLDADDRWVADKTATELDVFARRPDVDLCVGHYLNFWDEEVADQAGAYRDHPLSRPLAGYIVPTLLARRDTMTRFGPFLAGVTPSDTTWFARAVRAGARIETVPDVLLHRRIHRGNHSRTVAAVDELLHLIRERRRGRA